MTRRSRSDALTDLILEVFRLNGRLLAAGDALVQPIGLTSARWQVLGAIALGSQPMTVAELARSMGLAPQSVQRIVNELEAERIVQLIDNPSHKRAKRVILSKAGETLYAAALERQMPWARSLSEGLDLAPIEHAAHLLRSLRRRLETSGKERLQ